jgi:hypothetical protein
MKMTTDTTHRMADTAKMRADSARRADSIRAARRTRRPPARRP